MQIVENCIWIDILRLSDGNVRILNDCRIWYKCLIESGGSNEEFFLFSEVYTFIFLFQITQYFHRTDHIFELSS